MNFHTSPLKVNILPIFLPFLPLKTDVSFLLYFSSCCNPLLQTRYFSRKSPEIETARGLEKQGAFVQLDK